MTKIQMFDEIKNALTGAEVETSVDEMVEFLVAEQDALARKAEKAKVAAAKKREANQGVRQIVADALTDEPMTVDALVEKIGDEEITRSKIIYHVSQISKDGMAIKEETVVSGEDGKSHKKVTYRKA